MFTRIERQRPFLFICLLLALLVSPSWASPGGSSSQRSYLHHIERGQTVDIQIQFPNGSHIQALPNLPRGLQMMAVGPNRWHITGRLDPRTPLGLYEIRMGNRFRLTFNCVQSLTAWSQHTDLNDRQKTDPWNSSRFDALLRTGYVTPTPSAATPSHPYDLVTLQGVRHTLIRRQLLTRTLLRNRTHQHPAGSSALSQSDNSGLVSLVSRQFKIMRHVRFSFPPLSNGRTASPAGSFTMTQIQVSRANRGEYFWLVNIQIAPGPGNTQLRRSQLWQLQRRIDQLTDLDHPVLLLGNLNVMGDSLEYRSLLSSTNPSTRRLLNAFADSYRLVHALPTAPSYRGATFDRIANPYARKRFLRPDGQRTYGFGPQQRLDYVLVRQGRLYQLGINALECMNRPSERLSPHYGLKARFHLIHPRVVSSSSIAIRSNHGGSSPSPLTRSRGSSLPNQRDGDRGLPSALDLRLQQWAEDFGKGLGLTGEDVLGQFLGGNGQSILDQLTAQEEQQRRNRHSRDPFAGHPELGPVRPGQFPGFGSGGSDESIEKIAARYLEDAVVGAGAGAAGGALAGSAVGGVGALPGAIAGAKAGAIVTVATTLLKDIVIEVKEAVGEQLNGDDPLSKAQNNLDRTNKNLDEANGKVRNARVDLNLINKALEKDPNNKNLQNRKKETEEELARALREQKEAEKKVKEAEEKKKEEERIQQEVNAASSNNRIDPPDPFDGTVIETPEHRIDLDRIFLVREKSGFLRAAVSEIGQRVNEANSRPGAGEEGPHGPYPGTRRPDPGSGLTMPAPEQEGAAGEDPRARGVASRNETDPGPETTNPDPNGEGDSGSGGSGNPPPPPPAPHAGSGSPGGGFGGGSSPPRGQPTR